MNDAEDIRLKEFRQFKKEIRGSKEYLIVGIDVAKEKHHAFFGTATGKTLLRRLIFDNTIDGFEKLLTRSEPSRWPRVCQRWSLAWNPRPTITSRWESI